MVARTSHGALVRRFVELVHATGPCAVCHGRPVVLVETGCVRERVLSDAQREAMIPRVEGQRSPRHRKQLIAHAKETPEGQDGISDLA